MIANIQTQIDVNISELIKDMTIDEIAELLCAVAERFDNCYVERTKAAKAFSLGMSENGCRFMAEIVTQHFMRNRD